jgi:hypothetical protein
VFNILQKDGFNVSVVQNPTISLEGDVAAAKMIVDQQAENVLLVGHSYGEAPGSHAIYVSNPSAVAALIKVAASS